MATPSRSEQNTGSHSSLSETSGVGTVSAQRSHSFSDPVISHGKNVPPVATSCPTKKPGQLQNRPGHPQMVRPPLPNTPNSTRPTTILTKNQHVSPAFRMTSPTNVQTARHGLQHQKLPQHAIAQQKQQQQQHLQNKQQHLQQQQQKPASSEHGNNITMSSGKRTTTAQLTKPSLLSPSSHQQNPSQIQGTEQNSPNKAHQPNPTTSNAPPKPPRMDNFLQTPPRSLPPQGQFKVFSMPQDQGKHQVRQNVKTGGRIPQMHHPELDEAAYYDEDDDSCDDDMDEDKMYAGFADGFGYDFPSTDDEDDDDELSEEESALLEELRFCDDGKRYDDIIDRLHEKGIDPEEIEELLYHSSHQVDMYPKGNALHDDSADEDEAEGAVSSSSQSQLPQMRQPRAVPVAGHTQFSNSSIPQGGGYNSPTIGPSPSNILATPKAALSQKKVISSPHVIPRQLPQASSTGRAHASGHTPSQEQQQQGQVGKKQQLELKPTGQPKKIFQNSPSQGMSQRNARQVPEKDIMAPVPLEAPSCSAERHMDNSGDESSSDMSTFETQAQNQVTKLQTSRCVRSAAPGQQKTAVVNSKVHEDLTGCGQSTPVQQQDVSAKSSELQTGPAGSPLLHPAKIKGQLQRTPIQGQVKSNRQQEEYRRAQLEDSSRPGMLASPSSGPLPKLVPSPALKAALEKNTAPSEASLARLNVEYMQKSLDQEIMAKKAITSAGTHFPESKDPNFRHPNVQHRHHQPSFMNRLPHGRPRPHSKQNQMLPGSLPKHQLPPRQPIPAIINPNSSTVNASSAGKPVCSVVPYTSENQEQIISKGSPRGNAPARNESFIRPLNPVLPQDSASSSAHSPGVLQNRPKPSTSLQNVAPSAVAGSNMTLSKDAKPGAATSNQVSAPGLAQPVQASAQQTLPAHTQPSAQAQQVQATTTAQLSHAQAHTGQAQTPTPAQQAHSPAPTQIPQTHAQTHQASTQAQPAHSQTHQAPTQAQPAHPQAQSAHTQAHTAQTNSQQAPTQSQQTQPQARQLPTPTQPTHSPAQPAQTPAQPTHSPAQPAQTPAQPTHSPAQPSPPKASPSLTPAQQAHTSKTESFSVDRLSKDKCVITGKRKHQNLVANMVYQIKSPIDGSHVLALWNGEKFEDLKQTGLASAGGTSPNEKTRSEGPKAHTGHIAALGAPSNQSTYVKPLSAEHTQQRQGHSADEHSEDEHYDEDGDDNDDAVFKKPFVENEDYHRVCPFCGFTSTNLKRCESCRRIFRGDIKIIHINKQSARSGSSRSEGGPDTQSVGPAVKNLGHVAASFQGRSGARYIGNVLGHSPDELDKDDEDSDSEESSADAESNPDESGWNSYGLGKRPVHGSVKDPALRKRPRRLDDTVTVTISSDEDEPSSTSSSLLRHALSPSSHAGSKPASFLFPQTRPAKSLGKVKPALAQDKEGNGDRESSAIQQQQVGLPHPPRTGDREASASQHQVGLPHPLRSGDREPSASQHQVGLPHPPRPGDRGKYNEDDDDDDGMDGDDDGEEPPMYEIDIRSVRVGSMRTQPEGPLLISLEGVCIKVRSERTEEIFDFEILAHEVEKVKYFLGEVQPVLYLFVSQDCGEKLRSLCHMELGDEEYFDPLSTDMKQKMIVIIIEGFSYLSHEMLRETLSLWADLNQVEDENFIEELTDEGSNDLLIQSAPPVLTMDIDKDLTGFKQRDIKKLNLRPMTFPSSSDNNDNEPDSTSSSPPEVRCHYYGSNIRLLQYPPPPAKRLSITTEDLFCLTEGEFLNDVIIDFYLQYLYLEKLSEEDRRRTHIFSSFFYKRLMQKDRHDRAEDEAKKSLPEKRHARVKKWTKTVDLFSKDFIIIPINENSHWYLAVICFPGLPGPEPVSYIPSAAHMEDFDDDDDEADDIATILGQQLNAQQCSDEDIKHMIGQKQPCILMFDSLAGPSRIPNVRILRDYLQCEWNVKKSEPRQITKLLLSCTPDVPQQSNFSDCGVYLLQYVESFFEDPIADFQIPMEGLENWFPEEIVHNKRREIHELIMNLHRQYQIERGDPNILYLQFESTPRQAPGQGYPDYDMMSGHEEDMNYDPSEDMMSALDQEMNYDPSEDMMSGLTQEMNYDPSYEMSLGLGEDIKYEHDEDPESSNSGLPGEVSAGEPVPAGEEEEEDNM